MDCKNIKEILENTKYPKAIEINDKPNFLNKNSACKYHKKIFIREMILLSFLNSEF